MPKILRIPSEGDLPPGPRRELVEELFSIYRLARRPDLRAITEAVNDLDENVRLGSASRETIRQMLHGQTVPRQWGTAADVYMALCELADLDYTEPKDSWSNRNFSRLDAFEQLWNLAADTERPMTLRERQRLNASIAKAIRAKKAAK